MDPSLIFNVVTLLVQFLDVIRDACQDRSSKRRKLWQDELHLFRTQLLHKLQFANKIKQQAVAVGFTSESLEKLPNELQKFISSAKDLLSSENCKKKDIQELREHAMGTLQHLMECIIIEMCMKSSEDMKAIKEMMAKEQDEREMMSNNHGVHINMIFQSGNPMLTGLLSFVTETVWEHLGKVLAVEHLNLGVSTEVSRDKAGMLKGFQESGRIKEGAADQYLLNTEEENFFLIKKGGGNVVRKEKKRMKDAFMKDMEMPSAAKDLPKEEEEKKKKETCLIDGGAGMDEEQKNKKKNEAFLRKERSVMDEGEKKKEEMEGAGMVDEEEEKNKKKKEAFLTKRGAGMDVVEQEEEENKNRKEAALWKDTEKLDQRTTELKYDNEEQHNPNSNMQLARLETAGKLGELVVSAYKGSQWEVTYKWRKESCMGIVIGNRAMEVSKKLGYCYFEVRLVEMEELLEGKKETRIAGVGVGVASWKKLRPDKMAGKYCKSCGYDGRVGEVYYESGPQGGSSMGYLAQGDTIGVGILQHHHQHCIFFTFNGDLRMCIPDPSSLCSPSRQCGGLLLPVISLASAHVQVHVNFRGPFQLSDVLAQVKATLT